MTVTPYHDTDAFERMALWQRPTVLNIGGSRHYVLTEEDHTIVGPVARRRKPMFTRDKDKHEKHTHTKMRGPNLEAITQQLRAMAADLPQPPKRRWYRRMWDGFYNTETHEAVRQTGYDVLVWTAALFAIGIGAKILLWAWS